MSDYDESEYQRCLDRVSREVDQYKLNIQVITAMWDFVDHTDSLPCSVEGIEDSIWLANEEKEVEPDFIFLEEGQHYVLGEFKGRISDHEIDACIDDIEKYTEEFYTNREAVNEQRASPISPIAVFLVTHADHIERVQNRFEEKHGDNTINGVSICFISYLRYSGPGGQDRLRVTYEDGEIDDSHILEEIYEKGVTQPETDTEYEIKTLLMRAYTEEFYFYNAPPPTPYTVNLMVNHLDQYRDPTDPSSWKETTTPVARQEVIDSFQNKYTSEYTLPRTSWIKTALAVLEDYDWIHIDDTTLRIRWEEFEKKRRTDDMNKFFAKQKCREQAEEAHEEESQEDDAQQEITDY